jgi:hypothetical protein
MRESENSGSLPNELWRDNENSQHVQVDTTNSDDS